MPKRKTDYVDVEVTFSAREWRMLEAARRDGETIDDTVNRLVIDGLRHPSPERRGLKELLATAADDTERQAICRVFKRMYPLDPIDDEAEPVH